MWSNAICHTETFLTIQAIYREELDLYKFYDEIEILNNSCEHALMLISG